jgi:hypothetical protein
MKPTKPTRGRPSGEPTKQIRVYSADVPLLCRKGETQAEAVRRLVTSSTPHRVQSLPAFLAAEKKRKTK